MEGLAQHDSFVKEREKIADFSFAVSDFVDSFGSRGLPAGVP